jgi:hypothetical protein
MMFKYGVNIKIKKTKFTPGIHQSLKLCKALRLSSQELLVLSYTIKE